MGVFRLAPLVEGHFVSREVGIEGREELPLLLRGHEGGERDHTIEEETMA